MITAIRCAAALLALALARAAALGQMHHTVSTPVALVAYNVAACIVVCVWGLGRLNRRSIP